jgi:hypothetical protein
VHVHRRVEDRAIPGAAAEVSGERLDRLLARDALALEPEREERHHEARGAEAALGSMGLDHGALHRVQRPVRRLEALDRHHLLAVERRHEADARVDRAVAHRAAVRLAHDHGAGAAVALGAALLGAAAPERAAKVLQQRGGRGRVARLDDLAVEQEPGVAFGRLAHEPR